MKKRRSLSKQGPLSKKVRSGLDEFLRQKVFDISVLRTGQKKVDELRKTIVSEKELLESDPLHAIYAFAQNHISILVEQLAELPELLKLNNAYADAHEEYMPSYPPISPLTNSYFSFWGFFDLCAGVHRETFGTIAIDLCEYLKIDGWLIKTYKKMQDSRMGFYIHEEIAGEFVFLRELITEKRIKTIVPSGYKGKAGEIWFARVLAPPLEEYDAGYSVVITTPYIILEQILNKFVSAREESWLDFFDRNLDRTRINDRLSAYEFFMKYGLERHYWNEYIFQGYVNHKPDMILLTGFPDIPLSMPHSRESQRVRGE